MVKIEGLYNTAFCYTPVLEDAARAQIQSVCDQKEFAGCKIRVMPDVHAGKGCTIGTTMTIRDKIVPGMVGVDIGCGMETVELSEREIDFERLDALIRKEIPYGREVRDEIHALNAELDLSQLCCADQVNLNRAMRSIGSLGGGNHFIEVDRAEDGRLFLVVHSGSRHLGTEVANFYQDEGRRALWGGAHYQIKATIDQMKAEGRFKEIQKTITALKREHDLSIPKDLAYRTTPTTRLKRIVTELLERGCILDGVPGFYCQKDSGQWVLDIRGSGIMLPDRNLLGQIEAIQVRLDKVYNQKFYNLTSVDQYYGTQSKCCPHYVGVHEGDEVVCLTEGVMKSDLAYSFAQGSPYECGFVGLTGIPSYSQYERALEELDSIGVKRINVMVDSDYQVKEEVRKARDRYIEMGAAAGFEMAPITWTQKQKGVDDLYRHLFRDK